MNSLYIVLAFSAFTVALNLTAASHRGVKYAAVLFKDEDENQEETRIRGKGHQSVQLGPWLEERYSNFLTNPSDSSQGGKSTGVDQPLLYTSSFSNSMPLGVNLLKQIWKLMENKICKNSPALKLSILYTNNNTLIDVLTSLNIVNKNYFVYKAALIIELVNDKTDNSTGSYYVRIFYKNFTGTEEAYYIDIPKCGKRCPVQRFSKIYKNIFTLSCKINNEKSSKWVWIVIFPVVIYINLQSALPSKLWNGF